MKKFMCALLVVVNINCFGQANNGFVSISTPVTIGGPSASVKNQMIKYGYNEPVRSWFDGGYIEHPKAFKDLAVLVRGGFKLDEHKGFYIVVGRCAKGTVDGYKRSNEVSPTWPGWYTGEYLTVNYSAYQLTPGLLYTFKNDKSKVGFGPSVFLLDYSIENGHSKQGYSAVTPGVTGTARIPLGKERKLFGVEVVFEGNVVLPAKPKGAAESSSFKPGTVNKSSANIGLAFSLRS